MKKLFLKIVPVMLIISMMFVSCSTPSVITINPIPSKTSAPTAILAVSPTSVAIPAASATSVAMPSDDVWDRIVANQKIIVGTSWDYPPFASVDENLHVSGLDIALIEEIGRRLNIPVEVQNFTFEGLPDALQLNQIDVAIAAISITPERVSQASFSPIYYVNQTAILAKNGSPVTEITDMKQLVGYRVGVQRGTTYESMVQTALVDTKLMSADKLLSYMQSDEAISDLIANRVDVVILGQATARYYIIHEEMRMVGTGFDQQDMAIAMRLGTPRLQAEINRVMDDMLTDGTILALIQEYIESDVINALPTAVPTNQATSTPLPPIQTATAPVCINGMKFVADVTFGDNNMKNPPFVSPETEFVKTWRIENSGTCTWTPNYRLVYAYGNVLAAQMNGQPLNLPANVAPGQQIDVSVTLIAPKLPAIYQGFWQMETENGYRFGQTVWVAITTQKVNETPVATEQTSGNACVVISTLPTDSLIVSQNFDAVWTVKNTSGLDWGMDTVDYRFVRGTKMREKDRYDLTETIKNGESGKIIVDMNAPAQPGTYSTNWAIILGNKTICTLNVTVRVIAK